MAKSLLNERQRMQKIAGLLKESENYGSEINEEKVGFIDVNTVKKMVNKPEVKKMAATLEDNPEDAKKLAAALSDPKAMAILSGESISEFKNYRGKTLSAKERIKRFLKYAGVGSVGGALFVPLALITASATGPAILAMLAGGAIAGALVGALGGAAMTNNFKDSIPIEEDDEQSGDDIKDQIAQVLAFGKDMSERFSLNESGKYTVHMKIDDEIVMSRESDEGLTDIELSQNFQALKSKYKDKYDFSKVELVMYNPSGTMVGRWNQRSDTHLNGDPDKRDKRGWPYTGGSNLGDSGASGFY